ncbi:hypothetical protein EMN47_06160 [Prolixibacteraceae bacterium JC049]|nr:hypothetical protein [Prolixibacteraceae bacterium JC049]
MSNVAYEARQISTTHLPSLPIVDWSKIGESAPKVLDSIYKGCKHSLPLADVVVITWTSAEWSALDHVFVNSDKPRKSDDESWRDDWLFYSKDAVKCEFSKLWGYYKLVEVKGQRVLLFKSEAHLAHPPYIDGLVKMVQCIINDVKPRQMFSIGTAGGSSLIERLGDTIVTNSGHVILKKEENAHARCNNITVTSSWFPSLKLQQKIADNLLMPLSDVLTNEELDRLLEDLHDEKPASLGLKLVDLVNEPLKHKNIEKPRILPCKGIPLLTTDFYFIARGNDSGEYCTLEMDDTVVGYVAKENGVEFTFVRNISDPIVVSKTLLGHDISNDIRECWSSIIYKTCGFYTSFNGALTTWGCIAGNR